jgi:hypothetical protein
MDRFQEARKRFGDIELPTLQEGFLWDRLDRAVRKLEHIESRLLDAKSDFAEVVDMLLGPKNKPFSKEKMESLLFFAATVLDEKKNIHPEAEGTRLVFKIREFLAKAKNV